MDEHKLITGDNIITKQMGGAAVAPEPSYVINEKHEKDILEIFSDEINNAIINIKQKLGTTIANTNKNAEAIMQKLNDLKDTINSPVKTLKEDNLREDNETRVKLKDNEIDNTLLDIEVGNQYVKDFTDSKYIGNTFEEFKNKDNGYLANARKEIKDLNTNISSDPSDIAIQDTVPSSKEVQSRLNNCHILEMLYLIKHEEVMKTFAFTLNLFDKYKYSIKLLLFILKYLVVKKPEKHAAIESFVNVKLPKTLIPNIQTLLADQEKVQQVITGMKEQLETNPLGGVNENGVPSVLNPAGGPDETELDKRLDNLAIPLK